MAKDPAVLFYTSDFLSGTYTMTDEQVGRYIRLLCLQHQKGYLSEKDMKNICSSYDPDIYEKFEQKDGKFWNQRMLDESEKRKRYSESRANNRKKRKDTKNICNSYEQHMENENENIDVVKEKKKKVKDNKVTYRENVKLTVEEHQKLVQKHGPEKVERIYDYFSSYKIEKGYKTKSDYRTILRWVEDAVNQKENYGTNYNTVAKTRKLGTSDARMERAATWFIPELPQSD